MAQRYGGRFSPGEAPASAPERRPERMRMRRNLLYLAPLPLVLTAFAGGAVTLATDLAGLALLLAAAWLTGEGLKAEDAYAARRIARRPALPRKMIAALLTGLGVGLAVAEPGESLLAAALFGLVALALHMAAFGLDPLADKGVAEVGEFQAGRVAKAVEEAEALLAETRAAIGRTGEASLMARLERFAASARALFRTVEEDPRDLTAARLYLSVYLLGARDATRRFADLYARTRDTGARAEYLALLDDLQDRFDARTRSLALESRESLEVEIEVLRERLEREGVRTD